EEGVNEDGNVEQSIDYREGDSDKEKGYKEGIGDGENVLKENGNKEEVDEGVQNILNGKEGLNGDEGVGVGKRNGKDEMEELNGLKNGEEDGFKGGMDE
ncbi:FIVAR domain-containing protein, partial [Staphylococcus aureus]|uniref:FIVAR domain-containing protein n=1 Tax=Staphylococcus aureus TaxID=1280 RepID=UPI00164326AF